MNQRMSKLYKQALEFAYENVSKEIWNTDIFHAIVAGKFAELIVGECIRLCDQVDIVGADECIDNIKENFGVEE